MKVYIALDDSIYPPKIHSVFAQKEDADRFVLECTDYIVQEFEVIP